MLYYVAAAGATASRSQLQALAAAARAQVPQLRIETSACLQRSEAAARLAQEAEEECSK